LYFIIYPFIIIIHNKKNIEIIVLEISKSAKVVLGPGTIGEEMFTNVY